MHLLKNNNNNNNNVIACFNRKALFFVRCVFIFSNICISLSICLIGSVRVINLSDCFNKDIYFRFLIMSGITSLPVWLIN
jgi:hypothetical protein